MSFFIWSEPNVRVVDSWWWNGSNGKMTSVSPTDQSIMMRTDHFQFLHHLAAETRTHSPVRESEADVLLYNSE